MPEELAEVLVDVPHRQWQAGPAGEEPVPGRTPDKAAVVIREPDPQRVHPQRPWGVPGEESQSGSALVADRR